MPGMGGGHATGHERHAGHSVAMFRDKFWLSLALTIPVVVLSIAIPVAAGVLVPWGIDLPMAVGAIAMSVSTIIVAANAQLLRGLRLRREPMSLPAEQ